MDPRRLAALGLVAPGAALTAYGVGHGIARGRARRRVNQLAEESPGLTPAQYEAIARSQGFKGDLMGAPDQPPSNSTHMAWGALPKQKLERFFTSPYEEGKEIISDIDLQNNPYARIAIGLQKQGQEAEGQPTPIVDFIYKGHKPLEEFQGRGRVSRVVGLHELGHHDSALQSGSAPAHYRKLVKGDPERPLVRQLFGGPKNHPRYQEEERAWNAVDDIAEEEGIELTPEEMKVRENALSAYRHGHNMMRGLVAGIPLTVIGGLGARSLLKRAHQKEAVEDPGLEDRRRRLFEEYRAQEPALQKSRFEQRVDPEKRRRQLIEMGANVLPPAAIGGGLGLLVPSRFSTAVRAAAPIAGAAAGGASGYLLRRHAFERPESEMMMKVERPGWQEAQQRAMRRTKADPRYQPAPPPEEDLFEQQYKGAADEAADEDLQGSTGIGGLLGAGGGYLAARPLVGPLRDRVFDRAFDAEQDFGSRVDKIRTQTVLPEARRIALIREYAPQDRVDRMKHRVEKNLRRLDAIGRSGRKRIQRRAALARHLINAGMLLPLIGGAALGDTAERALVGKFRKEGGGPGSGVTHTNTAPITVRPYTDMGVTVGRRHKIMEGRQPEQTDVMLNMDDITHVGQKNFVVSKLNRFLNGDAPLDETVDVVRVIRPSGKKEHHLMDGHHRFLGRLMRLKKRIKANVWSLPEALAQRARSGAFKEEPKRVREEVLDGMQEKAAEGDPSVMPHDPLTDDPAFAEPENRQKYLMHPDRRQTIRYMLAGRPESKRPMSNPEALNEALEGVNTRMNYEGDGRTYLAGALPDIRHSSERLRYIRNVLEPAMKRERDEAKRMIQRDEVINPTTNAIVGGGALGLIGGLAASHPKSPLKLPKSPRLRALAILAPGIGGSAAAGTGAFLLGRRRAEKEREAFRDWQKETYEPYLNPYRGLPESTPAA